jgi:hypothetical protein
MLKAATLDADWFIHHDADEFRESPWPGVTLRESLRRVEAAGYTAVDFEVLHFWPTDADTDALDVRGRMPYHEPARPWDEVQIKCWKKTGQPVDLVSSGGHEVVFEGRRVFPIPFLLRHYPIRSQAHGERKVFQERRARFKPSERARGWHVQYDQFEEGASFVRDAASLTRYDEASVKQALWLRHRDVERLSRERADLARDRASLARALEELQSAHAHVLEKAEALSHESRVQREELDRLRADFADQQRELEAVDRERACAIAEVQALRNSWSWRLTRPLRSLPLPGGRGRRST